MLILLDPSCVKLAATRDGGGSYEGQLSIALMGVLVLYVECFVLFRDLLLWMDFAGFYNFVIMEVVWCFV